MYLLDTNVVSELRRPERSNPDVNGWLSGQAPETLFTSVIVAMELEFGALQMLRRDERQGSHLVDWVRNRFLRDFAGRTLPVTLDVALQCASLHVPDPKSERDAWIAATAIVHDLTVVTRNTRDFAGTGVKLLNPWLPQ